MQTKKPPRASRWCIAAALLFAACADDAQPANDTDTGTSTGDMPSTVTLPPPTTTTTMSTSADTTDGDTTAGETTTEPQDDSTTDETTAAETCGNGIVDGDEDCDGDDLGAATCESLRFDDGTLACADDCTFDLRGCISFSCGNAIIEGAELCDGDELGAEDCISQGFDGGTLACDRSCAAYDTSGCYECGDGVIGGPEVCDGDDLGGETCISQGMSGGTLGCVDDCSAFDIDACEYCGNAIVEPGEACDGSPPAGQTCATLGFFGGPLSCSADCSGANTSNCAPFNGTCCASNGSPGCNDGPCTLAVCAFDPFCCATSWDPTCATEANGMCSACGGGQGDCCGANGTQGCDSPQCVYAVCGPFAQGGPPPSPSCCTGIWTQSCANQAAIECSVCQAPGCGNGVVDMPGEVCDGGDLNGQTCVTQGFGGGTLACQFNCAAFNTSGCTSLSCCVAHAPGNPGCTDAACQQQICQSDSFCCNTNWDQTCANAANNNCAVCTTPATCGNGALDPPAEVCDADLLGGATCESQGFDGGTLACGPTCTVFDTSGCEDFDGDCCSANPTIGCFEPTCTTAVCADDPDCCEVEWDQACADAANATCSACQPGTCGNDVIELGEACDGTDVAGQSCPAGSPGAIACASDCSALNELACCIELDIGSSTNTSGTTVGSGNQFVAPCAGNTGPEITIAYTVTTSGVHTINTFGSAFDTVLWATLTCGGAALACNDDTPPGTQSQITVNLTAGQVVLIHVGGFGAAAGNYQLTVIPPP